MWNLKLCNYARFSKIRLHLSALLEFGFKCSPVIGISSKIYSNNRKVDSTFMYEGDFVK